MDVAGQIHLDEVLRSWLDEVCGDDPYSQYWIHTYQTEVLPLDAETKIRQMLTLDDDEKELMCRLLATSNGIPLESFGIKPSEWRVVEREGICCCARLSNFGLARLDKHEDLLKALPLAFDERVWYLTGMVESLVGISIT